MSPDVKPPQRTEQARTRLARAAVVGAARQLFEAQGYAATTLEAISQQAGVPAPTLYRLFGSKIGVLTAVLDVAAGGDDEPIAFGDRPDVRARLALDDPHEQVAAFAELVTAVMGRLAPIQLVLIGAAATDPEAQTLLAEITRQRQQGQARIAAALARGGHLGAGITERVAADIIHALMSPEVYRLLINDRGWTPKRYTNWLTTTLQHQLLPHPPTKQ